MTKEDIPVVSLNDINNARTLLIYSYLLGFFGLFLFINGLFYYIIIIKIMSLISIPIVIYCVYDIHKLHNELRQIEKHYSQRNKK